MMQTESEQDMKKRIRILFKISGGDKIGLGHIRRSMDLAEFLQDHYNAEIFFCCNPLDPAILRNRYGFPFFFIPTGTDDTQRVRQIVQNYRINVVIIDDIQISEDMCSAIKEQCQKTRIIALDHFTYTNTNLDMIINLLNQNTEVEDPSSVFPGQYREGVCYAIIRDALIRAGEQRKVPEGSGLQIVVTFGGADMRGNTLKVLNLLSEIERPFSVCVIIGPMVNNPEKIALAAKKLQNCSVVISPDDYDERVANADLGFIGGGTTMLEFCALGIPVIVVPQNAAEARFASQFEQKGAVALLKDDCSEGRMIDMIAGILGDKQVLSRMTTAQLKMVDSQGKDRIARMIVSGFD